VRVSLGKNSTFAPRFVPEPPVPCTFCCHPAGIARYIIDWSGRLPEHAPLLPSVPASITLLLPFCFTDICILCFRLNKTTLHFRILNYAPKSKFGFVCKLTELARQILDICLTTVILYCGNVYFAASRKGRVSPNSVNTTKPDLLERIGGML
jgi:hypothetical protein